MEVKLFPIYICSQLFLEVHILMQNEMLYTIMLDIFPWKYSDSLECTYQLYTL